MDEPRPELPTEPRTGPRPDEPVRLHRPGRRPARSWRGVLGDLRDRWPGRPLELGVGVLVVAVAAVVAGVVWYRAGVDTAPPPRRTTATASRDREASTRPSSVVSSAPSSATTIVADRAVAVARRGTGVIVHVAGAVRAPGVMELPTGARVIDAVEGAGGALPDADLDRLNLAAKLLDGQRVLVPKAGAVGAVAAVPGVGGDGAEGAPIDLNSATLAQLDTLPGIGPTLAAAIVAERDRRGGFRSVEELREVRGIGEARFADLRDRVTV